MSRDLCSFRRGGVSLPLFVAAVGVCLLFLARAASGEVHDGYEVRRLGLIGAGYQNSSTNAETAKAEAINSVGQVIGYSFRYDGTSIVGRAAWIDDGTTTRQLGYTGTGYHHDDGTELSEAYGINTAGHVIGISERYQGTASLGKVAWVDDGTTLRQIGFTGAGYQKSDGTETSFPVYLNDAGFMVGGSKRFGGSSWLGDAVWLDDGRTTSRLGLTGGEFQKNSTGWEYSDVNGMNAGGQVVGFSERFNSFNNLAGQAAWISTGATTRRIGLTGPEYHRTGTTDEEYSEALFLSDAGQSAGISKWYDANAFRGYAAWLDDGATAHRLGFAGPGYENTSTGAQESRVEGMNLAGQVVGYSVRYDGTSKVGKAAWVDDGTTARRLGFTGTGFQRSSDGKEESRALTINDAGLAIGESNRYNGASGGGQAAWLDDGTTLHELGFTGTGYERNDGYLFSEAQAINEAGQVMGFSKRYNGSSYHGKAGWYYDSATDTLTELIFSTRDDGRVNTDPKVLTADGTLWGLYNKYDGSTDLGRRPFAWDATRAFHD